MKRQLTRGDGGGSWAVGDSWAAGGDGDLDGGVGSGLSGLWLLVCHGGGCQQGNGGDRELHFEFGGGVGWLGGCVSGGAEERK